MIRFEYLISFLLVLPYHVSVVQISGMEGPGESEMEELVR